MMASKMMDLVKAMIFSLSLIWLSSCGHVKTGVFHDPNMDFSAIRTVAVLPFANLTNERQAGERVRDVFITTLLANSDIYVLSTGEVFRGIVTAGISDRSAPSAEEVKRLAGIIKANAVITGVVKEYGTVRSGSVTADVISLSLQMVEAQTGKIVWAVSTTKGGVGIGDRLLGGGGAPMNDITQEAIDDLINKLFK
jgi:hypothetical protein